MRNNFTVKKLKRAIALIKKHDQAIEQGKKEYLKALSEMLVSGVPLDHTAIAIGYEFFCPKAQARKTVFNFPFVVIDGGDDCDFAVMKGAKDQIVVMGVDRAIPNVNDCTV